MHFPTTIGILIHNIRSTLMKKTDSLEESLFATLNENKIYKNALSRIGMFEKLLSDGTGFLCTLWEKWGYDKQELVGNKWKDLIHPEDLDALLIDIDSVMRGDSDYFDCEYRIITKSNGCRWVLNRGLVIERDSGGNPLRFLGIDIDITGQKKYLEYLDRARREAEQRAQEAETLRNAGTIIASSLDFEEAVNLILEQALLVVPYESAAVFVVEEQYLELVGFSSSLTMTPKVKEKYTLKDTGLHARVIDQATPAILSDRSDAIPELGGLNIDKPYTWMGIPLHFHSEVIGIFTFVSGETFAKKHLRLATSFADHVSVALHNAKKHQGTIELATIDPLTNTCTRRWFFNQAELIFKQTVMKGHELSILMVDIDHFKEINDTYGHTIGDSILHSVCQACMVGLRTTDVMGRYGGEEFSIILPESGAKQALLVAERLRRNVESLEIGELNKKVTVSVGICTFYQHKSLLELIQEADSELYRAKESGRNRVCSNSGNLPLKRSKANKNGKSEKKSGKKKH